MKKILVATDFSNCAGNAMDYAMGIAQLMSAQVVVIHAIGSTEGINNNTYSALYIEDYYKNKRQALAEWAATYSVKKGFGTVSVTTLCDIGTVKSVICNYLEANPVELLVMGTMGSTGIAGIFGTNAHTMVENTKTPTLIIPLGSKFSMKPVITLATDFTTHLSEKDVNGLNELIAASGASGLNVLTILEGPEWKKNPSGEEAFVKLIPGVPIDFKYINEDNTIEGILAFIQANSTDILCLVKHHHNIIYRIFNRSTVNQVMNRSIKAVLVLHE